MKRHSLTTIARRSLLSASLGGAAFGLLMCDPRAVAQGPSEVSRAQRQPHTPSHAAPIHVGFAQFQIPFNIEPSGLIPAEVQLWVSTDEGKSWQMQGSAAPDAGHFPFRAASEGIYLFAVRTIDRQGVTYPSTTPPLRISVDTTKPAVAMRAEVDAQGMLAINVRAHDDHLDPRSAILRLRTDRSAEWREVSVPELVRGEQYYESQFTTSVPACREVALVLTIRDQANNSGETTFQLDMPRTAQAEADLRLASLGEDAHQAQRTHSAIPPLPGGLEWRPETTPLPGQLTSSEGLMLNDSASPIEELPLPPGTEQSLEISTKSSGLGIDSGGGNALELSDERASSLPSGLPMASEFSTADSTAGGTHEPPSPELDSTDLASLGQAYHCKSRAFSLDYSVDSLGASALADVELWGTEDGGRRWSRWGSDPDRQSPFDVQVGNDGLFGFRMVVVGSNGVISNRPKDGDSADVWINIDTTPPSVKISRAVYGEGPETGMLVIDYQCNDSHLVDRPVSLAYSESPNGPWNTFVLGLKNTGTYLWKVSPTLPDQLYVKVEVVDKAGNIGSHRMDLPIDTKGLAPRGRIHGFRPIALP